MNVGHTILLIQSVFTSLEAVPPEACFAEFNRADCGRRPTPVVYYWKSGSRCEVAMWRGCPNMNMFDNEFDCVSTCIFTARAGSQDYHDNNLIDVDFSIPTIVLEDFDSSTTADSNFTATDGGKSEVDGDLGNNSTTMGTTSGSDDATTPTTMITGE